MTVVSYHRAWLLYNIIDELSVSCVWCTYCLCVYCIRWWTRRLRVNEIDTATWANLRMGSRGFYLLMTWECMFTCTPPFHDTRHGQCIHVCCVQCTRVYILYYQDLKLTPFCTFLTRVHCPVAMLGQSFYELRVSVEPYLWKWFSRRRRSLLAAVAAGWARPSQLSRHCLPHATTRCAAEHTEERQWLVLCVSHYTSEAISERVRETAGRPSIPTRRGPYHLTPYHQHSFVSVHCQHRTYPTQQLAPLIVGGETWTEIRAQCWRVWFVNLSRSLLGCAPSCNHWS